MILLTCNCLLHLFMNLIHTYNSFYSPLLALYTNIIILRKSYSPQKGSHHTYLNKEDKRDYYPQINFSFSCCHFNI